MKNETAIGVCDLLGMCLVIAAALTAMCFVADCQKSHDREYHKLRMLQTEKGCQ